MHMQCCHRYKVAIHFWKYDYLKSLGSIGATLLHWSSLTALSHYSNQCWLIIKSGLWHSSENNFRRSAHYIDVIMTTVAYQITSLTVVYSTVYSDADQNKHQRSAPLAFVRGIHRDRWIPRTKGQLRGKCLHLMTSSCQELIRSKCSEIFQGPLLLTWFNFNPSMDK